MTYNGCNSASIALKVDAGLINALATTTSTVSANMKVHISLSQFKTVVPSNTSGVLKFYSKLQQKLVTTVLSGDFTKKLSTASAYLNATATRKAVVSKTSASGMTIQNPPTLAPTEIPTSKTSSVDSFTMYVMIIVIVSGSTSLLVIASGTSEMSNSG